MDVRLFGAAKALGPVVARPAGGAVCEIGFEAALVLFVASGIGESDSAGGI